MGNIRIGIIDNQMGNIASVANAIKSLGLDYVISSSTSKLDPLDSYILPGVGAFPKAIENFHKNGFERFLEKQVITNSKPFLGICLGMKILADSSEEQKVTKGLGWIPGDVVRIDNQDSYPVPHVGWNNLIYKKQSPLLDSLDDDPNFYFDHSYEFVAKNNKNVCATCQYGKEISSIISEKNIFGVQFHPEKSQRNGLKVLRAFTNFTTSK